MQPRSAGDRKTFQRTATRRPATISNSTALMLTTYRKIQPRTMGKRSASPLQPLTRFWNSKCRLGISTLVTAEAQARMSMSSAKPGQQITTEHYGSSFATTSSTQTLSFQNSQINLGQSSNRINLARQLVAQSIAISSSSSAHIRGCVPPTDWEIRSRSIYRSLLPIDPLKLSVPNSAPIRRQQEANK